MEIALIGLGKMGANIARRLVRGGHRVVGYNRTPDITKQLADEEGVVAAFSLSERDQFGGHAVKGKIE